MKRPTHSTGVVWLPRRHLLDALVLMPLIVATTVVVTSTSSALVARLAHQTCPGASLGIPTVYEAGGWAVGLFNGTGGFAVIEPSLPLAFVGAAGPMWAVVVAGDGSRPDATAA